MDTIRNFFVNLLSRIRFRKHGSRFLNVLTILISAAVMVYFAQGLITGEEAPYRLVSAQQTETGAGVFVKGYILREETVLNSDAAITDPLLGDGQKTAAGQAVALGYGSAEARQRRQEIDRLQNELALYEYAGQTLTDTYDQAAADAQIRRQLLEMAVALQQGDYADAADFVTALKGAVLRRNIEQDDLSVIQEQAQQRRSKIEQLEALSKSDTTEILTPLVGYYCSETDGYETVLTPSAVASFSPSQLLSAEPAAVSAGSAGRIITGEQWYYAAVAEQAQISDLRAGSRVTLTLRSNESVSYPMTVSSVGQEEAGKCILLLVCDRYLSDIAALRQEDADVTVQRYEGLCVPKQAVRVNGDGEVGVYILESAAAKWKPIQIIYESGSDYIVQLDRSSIKNLWPGDEIMISSEDLYDGKVVF